MTLFSVFILIIGLAFANLFATSAAKNVVCYFLNSAQYRHGLGAHMVKDLDPQLCSHLVFAFAQLSGNTIIGYEPTDDQTDGQWRQFTNLKNVNPDLKTLLAVGGSNHGSFRFSKMGSTIAGRTEFVQNAIELLRHWEFDGLGLDWEYPGDSSTSDSLYFSALIQQLLEGFEKEAVLTNRSRLILSTAVPAGIEKASKGYNITELNKYLDIVNIKAYDYHSSDCDAYTDLASPLFSDEGYTLDVSTTINWYLSQGLHASKAHLGVAFFGRSWTLQQANLTGLLVPTLGGGAPEGYTRQEGFLSYYEICEMTSKHPYTIITDDIGKGKYAFYDDSWITYEDVDTLDIKMDFVISKNLGGAMVWSLDLDDFTGIFCGQSKYPLLTRLSRRILKISDQSAQITTTAIMETSTSTAERTTGLQSTQKPNTTSSASSTNTASTITSIMTMASTSPAYSPFHSNKTWTTDIGTTLKARTDGREVSSSMLGLYITLAVIGFVILLALIVCVTRKLFKNKIAPAGSKTQRKTESNDKDEKA